MELKLKCFLIIVIVMLINGCSMKSKEDTEFEKSLDSYNELYFKQGHYLQGKYSQYFGSMEDRIKLGKNYCKSLKNGSYKTFLKSKIENIYKVNNIKVFNNETKKEIFDIKRMNGAIRESAINIYCPEFMLTDIDGERRVRVYYYPPTK